MSSVLARASRPLPRVSIRHQGHTLQSRFYEGGGAPIVRHEDPSDGGSDEPTMASSRALSMLPLVRRGSIKPEHEQRSTGKMTPSASLKAVGKKRLGAKRVPLVSRTP